MEQLLPLRFQAILFFVIFIFCSATSFSQEGATILGNTSVEPESEEYYEAQFDTPLDQYTFIYWNVTGGTIIEQVINPTMSTIYCRVQWDNSPGSSGSISIYEEVGGQGGSLSIEITQDQEPCQQADAGPDKTICAGGSTTIGNTALTGYTYSWSPITGLNNPNIAQPTASPSQTTTYTLTISTLNLLQNGGFENGFVGFNTDYGTFPNGDGLCTGTGSTQYGSLTVSTDPHLIYDLWCSKTNHTLNGTKMLIIDASCGSNKRVWYQSVAVSPNTAYKFSCWASNNNTFSLPDPNLRVRINGTNVIQNFLLTSTQSCNQWHELSYTWYSGTSTTVLIEIINDRATSDGNDYSLDDIYFGTCSPTRDEVMVTVGTNSPLVSPAGPITYYNQYEGTTNVKLTSSAASSYQWFKNNIAISGATNQTYTISMTGLSNSTDIYKCVTPCGTSNSVTFNYRGCNEASDYPVSIPWSPWPCKTVVTNSGIQLNAPSLGTGTTYSYWLYYPSQGSSSCYSINSTGLLKCNGSTCADGVYVKSALNGAETYMYYTFTTNPGCRVATTGQSISLPDFTEIAPNPANTEITISSPSKINRVEVFTMAGIQLSQLAVNNTHRTKISISNFKQGMYLCKVYTEDGVKTLRLQIQR
jgi:hypothetical protein